MLRILPLTGLSGIVRIDGLVSTASPQSSIRGAGHGEDHKSEWPRIHPHRGHLLNVGLAGFARIAPFEPKWLQKILEQIWDSTKQETYLSAVQSWDGPGRAKEHFRGTVLGKLLDN